MFCSCAWVTTILCLFSHFLEIKTQKNPCIIILWPKTPSVSTLNSTPNLHQNWNHLPKPLTPPATFFEALLHHPKPHNARPQSAWKLTNFGLGCMGGCQLGLKQYPRCKKDFSDGSFALNTWMLSCWSNADVLGSVSIFWPQKINVKTCPELRMVRRLPLKKTM